MDNNFRFRANWRGSDAGWLYADFTLIKILRRSSICQKETRTQVLLKLRPQ